MPESTPTKIVLHSISGYKPDLDELIVEWVEKKVPLIAVVGKDCELIHDIIDEYCVGDGTSILYNITTWHDDETLDEVISFATNAFSDIPGAPEVVTF